MMEGCEIRAVVTTRTNGDASDSSFEDSVRIPIDKNCVPPAMARQCRQVVSQEIWKGLLQACSVSADIAEESALPKHATIREDTEEEEA
jgi:hypothetical protein